MLVSESGDRLLPIRIAVEHVGMLQVGKYIPGKIFGIVARASEPVPGFPTGVLVRATMHEQLLGLGCTLIAGVMLLATHELGHWIAAALLLLIVPTIAAIVYPTAWRLAAGVASRVARKVGGDVGELAAPAARTTACVALVFALQWLAVGGLIAIVLWSLSVDASPWLAVTGAYAMATVGGMAALVVPGGIGVREMLFVGLAAPSIGQPMAITLAATLRLALSAMDLLGGMLAIAIRRGRG
jgi:hypothetical protein